METVAIVGVGLIGASFGLALRKAGFTGEIVGVSSESALAAGLERGAISSVAELGEAAGRADLIYISQPVDRILQTIPLLAPILRPGALVTDAGSTKAEIVKTALDCLPPGSFIGGHPIAGKEQRGPAAADADLFRDRPYVLTPASSWNAHEPALRQTLTSMGANVIEMSAADHDRTLAFTSHLPQLLSTSLAAALAETGGPRTAEIFGPGLLDMTRLALSSPDLWHGILATNKREVSNAIDSLVTVLLRLRKTLGEAELARTFATAAGFAAAIRKPAGKY